ncbi:MAG: sugar phosphate isomerase/epimerase [Firmicutes bacterium]|nr:sugar phosphate isomerase/epimerase [Bacillota bacterium]
MLDRVALSSTQLWHFRLADVLRMAADLGYNGVEVWAEHVWQRADDPEAVRRLAESLGLSLTVHAASWDLNLAAINRGIREQSCREVERSMDLAAQLGAGLVTVHPGRASFTMENIDQHWAWLVESLRRLAAVAAERGVRLAVENMEPIRKEFINWPTDVNRLLDEVGDPRVGCTYDIAHVALERSAVECFQQLDRVVLVHLSDADGTALHRPLGRGTIDLPAIVRFLRNHYDGWIVLEGYWAKPNDWLAWWNKAVFDGLARAQEEAQKGDVHADRPARSLYSI